MNLTEYLKLSEEQETTLIGKKIHFNNGEDYTIFTVESSGRSWNNDFDCSMLELTTLRGGPSSVYGDFECDRNKLTSLENAPSLIGGYFSCSFNNLTSLEGAPRSVGGDFYCSDNGLTSLHDIHKIIKKINGDFWAQDNPITSCVLGVLLIEGCTKIEIDNKKVQNIINKYLPNHRGFSAVIECQSELLDAGYDEYAKL